LFVIVEGKGIHALQDLIDLKSDKVKSAFAKSMPVIVIMDAQ